MRLDDKYTVLADVVDVVESAKHVLKIDEKNYELEKSLLPVIKEERSGRRELLGLCNKAEYTHLVSKVALFAGKVTKAEGTEASSH